MKQKNKLYVVGIGPGRWKEMTIEAAEILEACEVIVGYTVYVEGLQKYLPEKVYHTTPMRQEVERCHLAIQLGKEGKKVAMVCSGDPELYGMAGLLYELNEKEEVEIQVIPGVTAGFSGGARLGAPLTHDTCIISLSDLLTPWNTIATRLKKAGEGDFVICLYNPSSKKRKDFLRRACEILLEDKAPDTLCGIVKQIGREGECATLLTLEELKEVEVDMFSTVFIGNRETKRIGNHMVTPRGYRYESM